MKTINKTILTILTLAGLTFLSGCAISIASRTSADLQERRDAMWRVEVFKVAPQDKLEEAIDAYEGDNALFEKINVISIDEARDKQFIMYTTFSGYGEVKRGTMLVDRKWDIQPGDIIDILLGRGPVKTLVKGKVYGLCWNLGFWYTCSGDEYTPVEKLGQILGVVCRNTEWSCRNDVSPGTMIGVGRKMLSASEYKGVEAESQQPIREDSYNFDEAFYTNSCADCADDDKIIYID